MRIHIKSKNVWKQILESEFLGGKIWVTIFLGEYGEQNLGTKLAANSFGSKFLVSKFWGARFGVGTLLGAIFWDENFGGGIFASKISFWYKKNTGEHKRFGEITYGEHKILGANF